jgi:large subunit ribosomal protein L46
MWTFPKWFYFREGTLSEQRYRQLNKDPVDNNPDIEFPRGRPEIRHNRDRRFKQEIRLPKTYKEADQLDGSEAPVDTKNDLARKIVPNSRVTDADKANDQTSLERKLSRTLYLVVSKDGKTWNFPEFGQQEELKPLDVLAQQGLTAIGGEKINYFNVSNTPCHVHIKPNKKSYLIKSHILSGEFIPTDANLKFLWLTKQELSEKLSNEYYNEIEHLLNEY